MSGRTRRPTRSGKGEQGQTIVLVAVSLFAILSMAALAIDVTTLYVASTEAQQAADAAALAGAKAFVTSGYTTHPAGYSSTDMICNGSNGLADYAAQSALAANTVSGVVPTITTSCDFTDHENPRITVHVQRSALPVFFARIWGATSPTTSSTATAEAYNPSGSSTKTPIQVAGVKPWLLPNCDPTNSSPVNSNCPGGTFAPFVDPVTGAIKNGGSFIGTQIVLATPSSAGAATVSTTPSPPTFTFYPLDIPENPPTPLCPACSSGNHGIYRDSEQCFNPATFTCGQIVNDTNPSDAVLDPRMSYGTGALKPLTDSGTQCLVHQTTFSPAPPLDCSGGPYNQDCFVVSGAGNPILITPGHLNPDQPLRAAQYISRSDSVVTVPLFDIPGDNLCPAPPGNCSPSLSNSAPVVGFLQLGIQASTSSGNVQAVILNASGCNSTPSGTPVSGGNVASIPVRLIQTQ